MRQWRRSGLSMAAFAREQGLEPQRVRYWRERLEPKRGNSKATRLLVPGVVMNVPGTGTGPVTLQLPRGVVVEARAARDVEPAWVAELVVALEAAR